MRQITDDDVETLRRAKAALEHPALAIRLAGVVGKPFDHALRRLPRAAHDLIASATRAAIGRCLELALRTLEETPRGTPRNGLHQLAVGLTGAAGGAFGLSSLAIELPITTTLMFRSICDIARSAGENMESPEAHLQCLTVLALGGSSAGDDDAETGYFALRAALAEMISVSVSELASRGLGGPASSVLLRLINRIAARFSTQVTQQVAAKSIPVIGAVLGAAINTVFMTHFQRMAEAHFNVRRLERAYGTVTVETLYRQL